MQQIEVTTSQEALSALAQRVESGEDILLTRNGTVVARITHETARDSHPSELTPEQRARARQAIAGIRALRDELKLGPFDFEEFKRDRDEGRR